MNNPKFKLILLFTNFGPYHLARLNASVEYARSLNGEVIGLELAQQELEYPWQINTLASPNRIISVIQDDILENIPFPKLATKLIRILNQECPDAIAIAGYANPGMLMALGWSLWYKKIAILLSETTEKDEPRREWKEKVKSFLVKKYQAALVGGKPHQRYLVKLGMSASSIFLGYDVVGNKTFHPDHIRTLPSPLDKPFFLAINRFVAKKNLSFLLTSYANYRQQCPAYAWDLVISGDGEMRSQLETQIKDLDIQQFVHLPGFLQQKQLLPYFAHAQCFIHASTTEQWGLVVNEAMAAGLPVLVSNQCGCYEDLILEGINGYGFDPKNNEQLTKLMLRISSNKIDLNRMGQASLAQIQNYTPEYFAKELIAAFQHSLASSQ
ncbi:MAG: glycosyltransferase [Microcystaceae cyanobacterium]